MENIYVSSEFNPPPPPPHSHSGTGLLLYKNRNYNHPISVNVKELISALLGVWLGTAPFRAKTHS